LFWFLDNNKGTGHIIILHVTVPSELLTRFELGGQPEFEQENDPSV